MATVTTDGLPVVFDWALDHVMAAMDREPGDEAARATGGLMRAENVLLYGIVAKMAAMYGGLGILFLLDVRVIYEMLRAAGELPVVGEASLGLIQREMMRAFAADVEPQTVFDPWLARLRDENPVLGRMVQSMAVEYGGRGQFFTNNMASIYEALRLEAEAEQLGERWGI